MMSARPNDDYRADEALVAYWQKELETVGHIKVMERLRQKNSIFEYWDKKMYAEAVWLLQLYDALCWEYVGWIDGRYDVIRIFDIFDKVDGPHFVYKYDPEWEDWNQP